MKATFLSTLLLFLMFISACKKDDGGSESCPKSTFSVNGGNSTGVSASVNVGNSAAYGFIELEYGSNGYTQGTGTKVTISGSYHELKGLNTGTYDMYLRGNCGGSEWSEWSGPKSFLVQQGPATCPKPTNLKVDNNVYMEWDFNGSPQNFEIEYGVTGFAKGSGTKVVTTNEYYSDAICSKGTTYDFYVRANCGNNDFSEWTGPYTFVAANNSNMCLPPDAVNAYGVFNGLNQCVGAEFQWDSNGEDKWEVVLVGKGNSPNNGTIYTETNTFTIYYVSCSGGYDFYIRAVCLNGSKTAWKGPINF